ncbi:MAG: transcription activator effector binding protein [Gemmatimonadetes bacterium]|nr:transcription activator effector binding protein [Gemmatimonadota bacterium]
MAVDPSHTVSVQRARPRGIAAVHARLAAERVPAAFAAYLDQVYTAARDGAVALDGQNVFLYRDGSDGEVEVDFGVGVATPFPAAGPVRYAELPAGRVATATHWGDYGRLGETHAAVVAWCRAHAHVLAGPRWEVYGHWSPGDAQPRTDVYYLLVE